MEQPQLNTITAEFDCVVVGGGFGGICAALAAARKGLSTALVQDRAVLGGNASSEIRVHIGGVMEHGYHYDARETGIVEELRLEIAVRDPQNEYFWIDTVLLTKCKEEPNLVLYLNTNMVGVSCSPVNPDQIESIRCFQQGSETQFDLKAKIFIDGTGDGTLGYLAGAEFRMGREGKDEFGEIFAPDEPDKHMLGASIMFRGEDRGHAITYTPPSWALQLTEDTIKNQGSFGKANDHERYWHADTNGWWWIELPNTISNNEANREQLQALIFGVWDQIKNKDPRTMESAKNFDITWIGQVPGKRESRRLVGDYILREADLKEMRVFTDQIAVGGWSMDLHPPGGYFSKDPSSAHLHMDLPYSIPYRSIYSKNIANLLIASRCISVSHVAHGSTRLIATLGCIGQAAGTAAALCHKYQQTPRDVGKDHMEELQQQLLKDDQSLIDLRRTDEKDLAQSAVISATSEKDCVFADPDTFIELYFPIAQRFYVSLDEANSSPPQIQVYLKNTGEDPVKVSGGLRKDQTRVEFDATEDLTRISIDIPANFEGWCTCFVSNEADLMPLKQGGNFWLYLEEAENIEWGKNTQHHWTGFRIGLLSEETEQWQTVRINGNPMLDRVVGYYGTFCIRITNVGTPYPAKAILNGIPYPVTTPNLWVGKAIRKQELKEIQHILEAPIIDSEMIQLAWDAPQEISRITCIFDTELNNSYPHTAYSAEHIKDWPIGGKSPKCIRDLDVYAEIEGQLQKITELRENYLRKVEITFEPITTKKLGVKPLRNWGSTHYSLYELRAYSQK